MGLNLLNIEERQSPEAPDTAAFDESVTQDVDTSFGFRFGRWFPGRGMIYSAVVHEVFFLIAVLVPWNYWLPPELPPTRYEVTLIKTNEPLILPALSAPQPLPALSASGAAAAGDHGKSPAPERQFNGVTHYGPQAVVSNPPKPDNRVQTVMQPQLVQPPKLPYPLELPNIVATKAAMAVPAAPVVAGLTTRQAQSALRDLAPMDVVPPAEQMPQQTAKVVLPQAAVVPPPPTVEAGAAQRTVPLPTPSAAPYSATGNSDRDLLVLNAMPATPNHVVVPPGQLLGAFAVSPTPPKASSPSPVAAAGNGAAKSQPNHGGSGTGPATGARGGGSKAGAPGHGTGTGTKGKGSGSGSAGAGKGSGAKGNGGTGGPAGKGNGGGGSGTGNNPGSVTSVASGSGSGSPFPGISIQGGTSTPSITAGRVSGARTPDVYPLTIVASGGSGGGLKDYGVFHNEAVYTIYVDIAGTGGTTWTLQYAVIHDPGSQVSNEQVVSPPYVLEKHAPQFPPALATHFAGRMVVVQGVIDTEGKVQKLRVIQSPHPALTQALFDALKLAKFGAAEAGGTPVAVKILLGIPID